MNEKDKDYKLMKESICETIKRIFQA